MKKTVVKVNLFDKNGVGCEFVFELEDITEEKISEFKNDLQKTFKEIDLYNPRNR